MADFLQTLSFVDAYTRKTARTYFITATDFVAARVVSDLNLLAVQNLSIGAVVKDSLAEIDQIASAPAAGANVDTGGTFSMALATLGKSGSVSFPMINPSVVNGDGTINLADALVTAWTAQYVAGSILISDGEVVSAINSGTLDK